MNILFESLNRRNENNKNSVIYADCVLRGENPPVQFKEGSTEMIVDSALQALNVILSRYGYDMNVPRRCADIEDMLNCILDPLGITSQPIDLSEKEWQKQGHCILGFLKTGEAVALMPWMGGFKYVCPSTGTTERIKNTSRLENEAYIIYRPYAESTLTYSMFVSYLLKITTHHDWMRVLIFTGAVTLLALVAPALNAQVLEELVPDGTAAYAGLASAAVLYLTVEVITAICVALKSLTLSSIKTRLDRDIQGAFLTRALQMPLSAFRKQSTGKLSNQMRNCTRLVNITVDLLFVTSITFLFSMSYIPQMTLFAPDLLMPAIIILAVEFILSVAAALLYANNQRKVLDIEANLRGEMLTTIKGISKLKSAGAQSRVYERWARSYRKLLDLNHDPHFLVKIQSAIPSMMSSISVMVLYAVAFPAGITGPEFIAFNASFALATSVMRQVISFMNSASSISPLIEQLRVTFEVPVDSPTSLEYVRRLGGNIRLENVNFTYGPDAPFDLRNLSLEINAGEKVAFVGTSGCGKSTVLRLIMGLEIPESGDIYFDGKSITALNRRSLGKQIGSVFQFSRVIPGTIRSNVSFGTNDLSDEEIWEALDMAAIGDYIRRMPQQLDTEISETAGGGFSGGQKQCLLLARAFARKPGILVLDEATSALDNMTQQKVINSMHSTRATVLMVAHRLSTVKNCDRIVVMDKGVIVEVGTYDELMERDGLFAELIAGQLTDAAS